MTRTSPRVSIITVVLDAVATIEDCLRSIYAQTYPDLEHVIVDGGSTDGTLELFDEHPYNSRLIIAGPDNGIYDAMNKGISASCGDIVAALNADDAYVDRDVIRDAVDAMQEQALDAVYADLIYVRRDAPEIVTRFWKAGEYQKGAFFHGWVPPHPTFFCRKNIFEKYGYFATDLGIAADFELMLRFLEKHHIRVGYVPRTFVRMRVGGRSGNLSGIIRGNRQIMEAFRRNGFRLPLQFFPRKLFLKAGQFTGRSGRSKFAESCAATEQP